jgi:hypothetical protein
MLHATKPHGKQNLVKSQWSVQYSRNSLRNPNFRGFSASRYSEKNKTIILGKGLLHPQNKGEKKLTEFGPAEGVLLTLYRTAPLYVTSHLPTSAQKEFQIPKHRFFGTLANGKIS